MVKEVNNKALKNDIAKKVLLDLPEWFGIDEYTNEYISKSSLLPFFSAYVKDEAIGFISLKETSRYTLEIYCMGVIKKYQGRGLGKALFDCAKAYATQSNYKIMQVKTVKQGVYDIYDKTNAFYKHLVFLELEVFPTLWDKWNPCQVFVLPL